MKVVENECIGCPKEFECCGKNCGNRNIPHYYCDRCDEETILYQYNEEELCIDCIIDLLERVY